jgi:hypothetical protein
MRVLPAFHRPEANQRPCTVSSRRVLLLMVLLEMLVLIFPGTTFTVLHHLEFKYDMLRENS